MTIHSRDSNDANQIISERHYHKLVRLTRRGSWYLGALDKVV
jgi:hypothetical protein